MSDSSNIVDLAPPVHAPKQEGPPSDNTSQEEKSIQSGQFEQKDVIGHHRGEGKFKQLSWQSLTICLIVEAIALGSLSLPRAFADLGKSSIQATFSWCCSC